MYLSKWAVAHLSVAYQARVSDLEKAKVQQRSAWSYENAACQTLGKSESWIQLAFGRNSISDG